MNPYEMIRDALSKMVPFANHTGVTLTELSDGAGAAVLEQRPEISNHVGSMHAGALFTLAEAASGSAAAGAFGSEVMSLRLVTKEATIAYKKIAKGKLEAQARTSRPGAELTAAIEAEGKVAFEVHVDVTDEAGDSVAEMTIAWHASKARAS